MTKTHIQFTSKELAIMPLYRVSEASSFLCTAASVLHFSCNALIMKFWKSKSTCIMNVWIIITTDFRSSEDERRGMTFLFLSSVLVHITFLTQWGLFGSSSRLFCDPLKNFGHFSEVLLFCTVVLLHCFLCNSSPFQMLRLLLVS